MIHIVAENHRHAEHFAYEHQITRKQWCYVRSERDILGLPPEAVILRLPGYYRRRDADIIDQIIQERRIKNGDI